MTDITELAQSLKRRAASANEFGESLYVKADDVIALVEALEKAQAINAAAEKLVRCKGRYHSEQNYRALAALFGVTTPDLPPLDAQPTQPCEHSMFWDASGVKRCSKCDSAEVDSSGIASGILRCSECSFVQTKNIISVTADTITTGNSESEPCPNGCGQLQPVTWKALAIQLMFTTKQGVSDLLEAKKRIAELESRTVTIELFRSFVTDADLAALHRFAECCDDPESGGHDLEKEQVRRLEAIGALQRSGRISYITDFGDVLISITAGIKWEAE